MLSAHVVSAFKHSRDAEFTCTRCFASTYRGCPTNNVINLPPTTTVSATLDHNATIGCYDSSLDQNTISTVSSRAWVRQAKSLSLPSPADQHMHKIAVLTPPDLRSSAGRKMKLKSAARTVLHNNRLERVSNRQGSTYSSTTSDPDQPRAQRLSLDTTVPAANYCNSRTPHQVGRLPRRSTLCRNTSKSLEIAAHGLWFRRPG
ncbi:hypothetical protein P280DRAFT_474587 [Massarina eburnea CBS 473.64]|uniref:Uncharacterized protein n=1 Tax=Massarina eburnea CBS 473.64 TaxID=1395130 RepID=A0A6A6RKJ3_9PLEO|nr:hypothetical protein P280DRAFT_474587 [Massarina eburnea CBS 473.64]